MPIPQSKRIFNPDHSMRPFSSSSSCITKRLGELRLHAVRHTHHNHRGAQRGEHHLRSSFKERSRYPSAWARGMKTNHDEDGLPRTMPRNQTSASRETRIRKSDREKNSDVCGRQDLRSTRIPVHDHVLLVLPWTFEDMKL
jgi:hypothetical protein